jgi:hypothetical protein
MSHELDNDVKLLTPSINNLTLGSGDEDDGPMVDPHAATNVTNDQVDDDYNGPFIPRRMPAREAIPAGCAADSTSPPPKVPYLSLSFILIVSQGFLNLPHSIRLAILFLKHLPCLRRHLRCKLSKGVFLRRPGQAITPAATKLWPALFWIRKPSRKTTTEFRRADPAIAIAKMTDICQTCHMSPMVRVL